MKDEIKEILNQLEIVVRKHIIEVCEDGSKIETMPASVVDELRLNAYSANILLDYITNLQEENFNYRRLGFKHLCDKNKELEEENKILRGNTDLVNLELIEIKNELEDKIDKAIEYINTHYLNANEPELLNILNGGDKE